MQAPWRKCQSITGLRQTQAPGSLTVSQEREETKQGSYSLVIFTTFKYL